MLRQPRSCVIVNVWFTQAAPGVLLKCLVGVVSLSLLQIVSEMLTLGVQQLQTGGQLTFSALCVWPKGICVKKNEFFMHVVSPISNICE